MAVGVPAVGRLRRQRRAHDAHHVGEGVEGARDAVAAHGERAGSLAVEELRGGHDEVEGHDHPEHPHDVAEAIAAGVGGGHEGAPAVLSASRPSKRTAIMATSSSRRFSVNS